MKALYTLLILLIPFVEFGQCISGDCQNGQGTYIYDTGKYEGDPLTGYHVKKMGIWYYKSRSKVTKLNVNAPKLNNTFAEYLKNH